MQLTFKKELDPIPAAGEVETRALSELPCGESAILHSLDLPEELERRLMELGFFPGGEITVAGCAPGGDPRVFRVDGSEVALRRETTRQMRVIAGRAASPAPEPR